MLKFTVAIGILAVLAGATSAAPNNVCAKYITTIETCFQEGLAKACAGQDSCTPCKAYLNPSDAQKKSFEARLNEPCTGQKMKASKQRLKSFKGCAKDEYVQKNLKAQIDGLKKTAGCK